MKKRIVSIALVLMMLLSLVNTSVFAAEGSGEAEEKATITVDTTGLTKVKVGDEISVPVKIKGNPGIAGYTLTATWDTEVFAAAETLYTAGELTGTGFSVNGNNAVWASESNVTGDGVLFTIHLKARKAAEKSEISVALPTDQEVNNAEKSAVAVEFVKGSVTVADVEKAPLLGENDKFYFGVTSGDTTVSALVDNTYKAVFTLPAGAKVNTGSMIVTAAMQNVASLGVSGVRQHSITINTGDTLGNKDVDLATHLGNAYKFNGGTINATIAGNKCTYTFGAYDQTTGTITATTITEAARAAWHALTANVTSGTQSEDNSYIVIKNGSYIKMGTEYLRFENETGDLTLDNFNNMSGLEETIRNAVRLDTCEAQDYITLFVKAGTTLAVSSSVATLEKDCTVTIKADNDALEALNGSLKILKDSTTATDMVKNLVSMFNKVVGVVDAADAVDVEFVFAGNTPKVDNKTGSETAPDAPKAEVSFKDNNETATVECDVACVVLAKTADGYVKLEAKANDNGGYDFDLRGITGEIELVVAVKGDMSGDGVVNSTDVAQAKTIANSKNATASNMAKVLANLNGDSVVNSTDVSQLKAIANSKMPAKW